MSKAKWLFSLMFLIAAASVGAQETSLNAEPAARQPDWAKQSESVPGEKLPPDENPNTLKETSLGAVDAVVSSAAESRDARSLTKWTALAAYSYFDLWVPSKVGVAAVYNPTPSDSYEIQFDRGSVGFDYFHVSLGKVSDERISVLWRRFDRRNSFNYFFGLHHAAYKIRLGSDLLNTVGASQRGAVDVMEINELGPTIGIGNRWQAVNGVVWSFDWLTLNFPLWTLKSRTPFLESTTSDSSRKDVQDALRLLKNVPTGAVVKVQLGYAF